MFLTKIPAFARWRVPVVIVGSFVLGLLFSVGHHLFYMILDGQPVPIQHLLIRQWAISIGTAFAFLVRAMLTVSVGATFWHLFWSFLPKKSLDISTIDSLAGSWGSVIDLLDYRVIKTSPLLACLAISGIAIIPLATIFPPGTLHVKFANYGGGGIAVYNLSVPTIAWAQNSPNFVRLLSLGTYNGPARNLVRAAFATSYQQQLPPLPRPDSVPNATYTLLFNGPNVQCTEIDSQILSNFTALFGDCPEGAEYCEINQLENIYTYLAWAPIYSATTRAANPFTNETFSDFQPLVTTLGTTADAPAQLYVSTLNGSPSTTWQEFSSWQTLNCSLFNASYSVTFSFESEEQIITVDKSKTKILNAVTLADGDKVGLNTPGEQSYLALMDVLGTALGGAVFWKDRYKGWRMYDTIIMDTTLARTRDISAWAVMTDNVTEWDTAVVDTTKPALASAIQDLFMNMTLSLFAFTEFTANTTVAEARSDWWVNHYDYRQTNLFISYGCVLLLTAVIAVVGCLSIMKQGSSYSNRLSTVIRTTRNVNLDEVIDDQDRRGEDPLPQYIASTKVRFGVGGSSQIGLMAMNSSDGLSSSPKANTIVKEVSV